MAEIYTGQNAKFELISQTHGRFELGFIETFEVDCQQTNKSLYFFNKKERFPITIFEGVAGRFGFLETEEKYLVAAICDLDPNTVTGVLNDDPGAYYPFNIILNSRNEAGKIRNGTLIKNCRISGNPETMAPRDEQHGVCSYLGATRYKLKGGAVLYSRIVSSAPPYSTSEDIVATSSPPNMVATIAYPAITINITDKTTTRNWLAIYKNGRDISYSTADLNGISIAGTTVTIPASSFATTDVYDIYTVYVD